MFDVKKGKVVESDFGRYETREAAEKELQKRNKRNLVRKEKDAVLRSVGLTKVRGNLGNSYWE